MLFEKKEQFNILSCGTCGSSGYLNFKKCPQCKGKGFGVSRRGKFLYWGQPLNSYHVRLRRGREILDKFNVIGAIVFGLGFLFLYVWHVYRFALAEQIFTVSYWINGDDSWRVIFWLSIISFSYMIYRISAMGVEIEEVETRAYGQDKVEWDSLSVESWPQVHRLSNKKKKDISDTFSMEVRQLLDRAYIFAESERSVRFAVSHLFYTILDTQEVVGIFVRLGVSSKAIKGKVAALLKKGEKSVIPIVSEDVKQVLLHAYEMAYSDRQELVDLSELLLAAVMQSEAIQEILYDFNIDGQKLNNVVGWVRTRKKLKRQKIKLSKAATRRSKHGLDRAMTAVATPFLNSFSMDLTLSAKYGRLNPCMARDKEIEEIFRIVDAGQQSVILVGEHGVGKMSIMEGIAQRMVEENVPERLKDKRLVYLSNSSLLAGTSVSGAQERLIRIMNEVARAGNIILLINNLDDLVGTAQGQGENLDVSETLAEYLVRGNFLTFATTTVEGYSRNIVNTQVGKSFSKVDIEEMDVNQTVQVLESKVAHAEYKNNVFFTYDALEKAAVLADQFMYDQNMPASAIEVMRETAAMVHSKSKELHLVKPDDVAKVISDKTGVLTTSITESESEKLLRLEEEMHQRIIGQHEAVSLVANALRRARAEMRSQDRPIANFLFLGPTGVGKTELAKTIAQIYFGSEERMIRLDMSEYQDKLSIYRLIGEPNRQGTGLLTEAVRQNPFSLLLLDELEKADSGILNLFLQVFDDGRLTDSVGRVINFCNTIIIATSNAGTDFVQEQLRQGIPLEQIRQSMIRTELKQYYRPEFLNRFDAIVLFKSLTKQEIRQIASLMLKRVEQDLEKRGITLRVKSQALDAMADVGYDPEFGARPMRRAIQDYVENKLAELLISGKLRRKDEVVLGENLEIIVDKGED